MSHNDKSALTSPLETVRNQFEQWRESRKHQRERIPEKLWTAAAGLWQQYSVTQISNALRLNYNDLKKRMPTCPGVRLSEASDSQTEHNQGQEAASGAKRLSSVPFIQLDWQRGLSFHRPVSNAQSRECVIEMEDACGSKMRMSFKGSADFDLLELGKAFWGKGK